MSVVRPSGHFKRPHVRARPRDVEPPPAQAAFKIVLSSNIAPGGEDTTTYGMTAPAGKSGADFTTGRRWDNENGVDALTIAVDDWTKVGWSIAPTTGVVVDTEQYEFRVVADGVALDTYSVTPKWTIGAAAGDPEPPPLLMAPMQPAGWPRVR
jgi:hypothetical protein